MRRIDLTKTGKAINARRWDVVVLGSARPGLFAAAKLTMLGLRVLVVEGNTSEAGESLLREPFFFGSPTGSPLDEALTACGIGRHERPGLERSEISYQVLTENARINVGHPMRCASEWVAYGLLEQKESVALVGELDSAGRAEATALTTQAIVTPARRARPSRSTSSSGIRGLPSGIQSVGQGLERFFQAQFEIFASDPASLTPECKARILGRALSGGGYFNLPGISLVRIVRKRISKVLGEFRQISEPFELVNAGSHPGILLKDRGEALLGRVLLINTPLGCLAECLASWNLPVPSGLANKPLPEFRQLALSFRGRKDRLPQAMHPRAVLATNRLPRAVAISLFPSTETENHFDLTAQLTVRTDSNLPNISREIEEAIQDSFPFSHSELECVGRTAQPGWDNPFDMETGQNRQGWPSPVEIRFRGRQPVYALPAYGLGGLGVEGEAVLGWRTAEAVAPKP